MSLRIASTNPKGSRVAVACHFGEWLQGRLGPDGPVALVTLVPDGLFLTAQLRPATHAACHAGVHGALSPVVLRRFLHHLGLPQTGRVLTRLPFAPGLGTGMSTATLVAIARLHRFRGPAAALARACIAAEGASDPLMFPAADRLLWASRRGLRLGLMPQLPRAHLLAGFFGPPRPTAAADLAYDDIADLVAGWKKARHLAEFAALSGESARRCAALRGPAGDPTADLAHSLGALGWVSSHSGAARALVFTPGQVPRDGAAALREAGLRGICQFATGKA